MADEASASHRSEPVGGGGGAGGGGEELEEPEEPLRSRPYQAQLEEVAVARNTIIHLPTGSGKTLIAIRLINRLKEPLRLPWGAGGKRTFFLVNTIPLVNQQKKVIQHMSAVSRERVAGYSGEDGVDYWDKGRWDAELAQYQVVVMTSQILADMLTHAYISLEDVNLLIFDECHHAVVDHPMRLVMKHFETCPPHKHPRVLGLTATLLNANVSPARVQATLRELETTFHATIATVNELGEVMHHSTNPREYIISYGAQAPGAAGAEAIRMLTELQELVLAVRLPRPAGAHNIALQRGQRDISSDPNKIVKEVKNMAVSMVMLVEELGVFGGALGVLAYVILLERLKRKAITPEEELLYKFARTHCLAARMVLLKAMAADSGYAQIVKHSSPKVLQLLAILKEYNPELYGAPGVSLRVNTARRPLSAIVFTKQRFTAKVLYNLLKAARDASPELAFLHHDFIVGFNINPMKSTREQYFLKKSSETALLKFCNKELNCLISTSVIEEGVDIPQCSLVLRFDPPLEYRAYIQSKGRARCAESSYVVMIETAELARFNKLYRTFQDTEQYIQKMLEGKTEARDAPTREDIQEGLYDEDEVPPYVTAHGTRLSSVSATSLLNRYCSALPHDQFTAISPMWVQELVDCPRRGQLRLVKIYMPIACPVKEPIAGQAMITLKGAKRAAALAACARLHRAGELDHHTLLPRRYGVVDFELPDVRACLPNWPWGEEDVGGGEGGARPGTKRCVRRHKRVFPACLRGVELSGGGGAHVFHLHVVRAAARFERPADSRELACYELLARPEGYGLLTAHALPPVCDFPLFLTAGEVHTSLEVNYAVIQLDQPLFELVKRFHLFVFDQVLECAKKFTVFEGRGEYCMWAVPLAAPLAAPHEGLDIDWALVRAHNHIQPVAEPPPEERKGLRVRREDYMYHVVSPWYRGSLLPARYIVSRVVEHLTPHSRFDSSSADSGDGGGDTFAHYYRHKYNLQLLGPADQPLLEVRNISSRMNCLVPRAASIRAFSDKQRRLVALAHGEDKPKAFPELFVPEFCVKYTFPGHMWYKAIMLPSVVHRVTMLLGALELRAQLAAHAGVARPLLPPGERWAPVQVDEAAAAAALLAQIDDPAPLNTVDRINNPIDNEAPRPVIMTMKESIYQYQRKKISRTYPWDEEKEPLDIERNVLTVSTMDLECYDEFVSAPMPAARAAPVAAPGAGAAPAPAILPPPPAARPHYYDDEIRLLSADSAGGPELRDVLAALTTSGAHDTLDLERAETLGDAFLKFAASLYLFHKFPALDEGQLTNVKCRLIGNRNLYYAGVNRQLPGRMKVEHFSPRKDFLVPGFFAPREVQDFIESNHIRPTFLIGMQFSEGEALSGRLSEESAASVRARCRDSDASAEREPPAAAQPAMQCYLGAQAVSDKCVADCVEALVGTQLVSGGVPAAVAALEWLAVLPPQDRFASMLGRRPATALRQGLASRDEVERLMNHCREDVEHALGYTFQDPAYLLEALSHPSYIRNRVTRSYERLEFLGDALLDFLITAHIFEQCGALRPGQLTDLRSALVNNVTFAAYVVRLGLHKYICYQLNPVLEGAMMAFVESQERRGHEVVEDVLYLIDEADCHVADYIEVPKVLSDVFESLVGAMYLDSGGRLPAVWAAVYRVMHAELHAFARAVPLQPVRVLHERIHACPAFGSPMVTDAHRVMVPVTFTRLGRRDTVYGCGANKRQAKRAAAKLALKILAM